MLRAAIYARYPSDNQRHESIEVKKEKRYGFLAF